MNKKLESKIIKLIVIQGIIGAGKSRVAKKILKKYGSENAIIVSRDAIRSIMGVYWIASREKLVTSIEDYMIVNGLSQGYTVIVDNSNLNPKVMQKLEAVARKLNVIIEYKPIKTSPFNAFISILQRSLFGGRFVSYSVIKELYNRYKNIIGV